MACSLANIRIAQGSLRASGVTWQVDDWLHDPNAAPDPNTLVMSVHFAGVRFPPTISKFTIDELKSTGDLRLLTNQALKRQVADYYNQIALQIDQWSAWGDVGIAETYFRELAFVMNPALRLRAGSFDPAADRKFKAPCSAELIRATGLL